MMSETPSRLFRNPGEADVGTMLMFNYDAKWKDTPRLPYFDMFPLIFVLQLNGDSFLSLNLHYLPHGLRIQLMDALYTLAVVQKNRVQRLAMSYDVLSSAARFNAFRPCLKKHLFSHVKSRFLYIRPEEWPIAAHLPLARWHGAPETVVFRDSRMKII